MAIHEEPKVDCHNHVFDPVRFPYAADAHYMPLPQETGTAAQFQSVLDAHGVRHALIVGPNSGYGLDNRCLLDAIATGEGRFKGIAVVRNDIGEAELVELKAAGIVGVAYNVALLGVPYYADTAALLAKLARLDLFVQVQIVDDQLVSLLPMLERSGARILIDHCGRPTVAAGVDQPGFRALLGLARNGRTCVKLSGHVKYSQAVLPLCRYVALRSRARRSVHSGRVRLGLRLAVPACAPSCGLWPAGRARRANVSKHRRSAQIVLGHAATRDRLLVFDAARAAMRMNAIPTDGLTFDR